MAGSFSLRKGRWLYRCEPLKAAFIVLPQGSLPAGILERVGIIRRPGLDTSRGRRRDYALPPADPRKVQTSTATPATGGTLELVGTDLIMLNFTTFAARGLQCILFPYFFCKLFTAAKELEALRLPQPVQLAVPANTLVVADTF